jgi:hypothetical protein
MNEKSIYVCGLKDCKMFLDQPINLPCGFMVCKKHIDNETNKSFKCEFCNGEHSIPENGFIINKKLADCIKSKLHLTGQHKEASDLFDDLDEMISGLEKIDPAEYVYDFFKSIRDRIDLHREIMINQINTKSEQFIKILNELEKECNSNHNKTQFKSNIDELKLSKLPKIGKQLKTPQIENNLLKELTNQIRKIEMDLISNHYENEYLLNNKRVFFEPIDGKLFGELKIFESNELHKITYPNGDKYVGEMMADFRHGFGIYYRNNGLSRYEGKWVHHFKNGYGCLYFRRTGNWYEGQFANDAMNGKGIKNLNLSILLYLLFLLFSLLCLR